MNNEGISPTVGVIIMVAITVALGVVIGAVALDLGGSTEESVQAGVDIQQTDTGEYLIQWQTEGNAEELHVLVNGEELDNGTLSKPGESISVSVGGGDTISVSGSSGDTSEVISSTTSDSGGTVSDPTVTSNPDTTLSSSTSSDTATQGESISVGYTVTNDGDEERDMMITLDVSDGVGEVDSTTETAVSSAETRTGSLEWSVPSGQEPGEYTLTTSGGGETSSSTVTIEELVVSEPHSSAPSNYSDVLNSMDGDGTSENPYLITNDHELQAMKADTSSYYEIANDIDASETDQWNGGEGFEPLTNYGTFSGTLDGNGYEIKGLYIDREKARAGLVGEMDGTIKNVGIVNADYTNKGMVGGIAGRVMDSGVIKNSYVENGHIVGENEELAGGIAGQNFSGEIRNTYATGTIASQSSLDRGIAGGIAGSTGCSSCGQTAYIHGSYSNVTFNAGNTYDITNKNTRGGGVGITDSTGLSESEMTGASAESTMSAFDFTNTWTTVEDPDDYPKLQG